MRRNDRRSVRVVGHDYACGTYFVTLNTYGRAHLFGRVVEGRVLLSPLGRIAEAEWLRTAELRPNVEIDAYAIMPDHLHGIVVIHPRSPSGTRRGTPLCAPCSPPPPRRFGGARPGTLATLVRQYKARVTRHANTHRDAPGARVWQRGYWDRIVRGERERDRVRCYIAANPSRWRGP